MEQYQQAMRQARSMARQGAEGDGSGDGRPGGDEGLDEASRIEIPAPEDFQTPEAYREALLEGMQADVPEEYRALLRRYYEDLVRQ